MKRIILCLLASLLLMCLVLTSCDDSAGDSQSQSDSQSATVESESASETESELNTETESESKTESDNKSELETESESKETETEQESESESGSTEDEAVYNATVIAVDMSESLGKVVDGVSKNGNGELLTRYDMVKNALVSFVKSQDFGEKNHLGVILFDSEAMVAVPLTANDKKDLIVKKIENSMESYFYCHTDEENPSYDNRILSNEWEDANGYKMKSQGTGTTYMPMFSSAWSMLYCASENRNLILVSDGNPKDYGIYDTILQRIASNGVVVSTVMVENDNDSGKDRLQNIAKTSGGRYRLASGMSELEQIFIEILNGEAPNTISFDLNGGEGVFKDIKAHSLEKILLPGGAPKRDKYKFVGWSSTKDGEVEYSPASEFFVGNEFLYTLYAVWEPCQVNVIVVDLSSSMGQAINSNSLNEYGERVTRFEMIINALVWAFENSVFDSSEQISVVLFSNDACVVVPLTQADKKEQIIDTLKYEMESYFYRHTDEENPTRDNRIENSGTCDVNGYSIKPYGTKYLPAIGSALDIINESDMLAGRIIFISDGEPSDKNGGYEELVTRATKAGVTTHTVQVGADSALLSETLADMARRGNGSFNSILNEQDFEYAVDFILNASCNSLALGYNARLQGIQVTGKGTCTDKEIVIPSTYMSFPVVSISVGAFSGDKEITSVTIGNNVTEIGIEAFYGCTSLTSINIPSSVTRIGNYALCDCDLLTSINVDADNASYKSIDGNLYSKSGKVLLQYAKGKSQAHFEIPEGVTSIENYAFEYCTSLTSVTIPNSVTSIGSNAFYGCTSLASITIPDSVTSMGSNAFYGCICVKLEKPGRVFNSFAFEGCNVFFEDGDKVVFLAYRSNASGAERFVAYREGDTVELKSTAFSNSSDTFFGWYLSNGSLYAPGEKITITENMRFYEATGRIVSTAAELYQCIQENKFARLGCDITVSGQNISASVWNVGTIDLNGYTLTSTDVQYGFGSQRTGMAFIGNGTVNFTTNDLSKGAFFCTSFHGYRDGQQVLSIGKDVTVISNAPLVKTTNYMTIDTLPKIDIYGTVKIPYLAEIAGAKSMEIYVHSGAEITIEAGAKNPLVHDSSTEESLISLVVHDGATLNLPQDFIGFFEEGETRIKVTLPSN